MICLSCGSEIAEGVNFCTYCGAEQKPCTLKVCKKCGYNNPEDAVNCKKCGKDLIAEGIDYTLAKSGALPESVGVSSDGAAPPPATQAPKAVPLSPQLPQPGIRVQQPKTPGSDKMPPILPKPQAVPGATPKPPASIPISPQMPGSPVQKAAVSSPQGQVPPPVQKGPGIVRPAPQKPDGHSVQQSPLIGLKPPARPPGPLPVQKPLSVQPVPQMAPQIPYKPQAIPAGYKAVPPGPVQGRPPSVLPAPVPGAPGTGFGTTPAQVKQSETDKGYLFCNICGAKNEPGLNECKYCQSPLIKSPVSPVSPAQPVKPQVQQPLSPAGIPERKAPAAKAAPAVPAADTYSESGKDQKGKICPKCKTENPYMMLICYNCGESLEVKAAGPGGTSYNTTAQHAVQSIPTAPGQSAQWGAFDLSSSMKESAAAGPPKEISKKVCPKCGMPNLLGSAKCGHCGFNFKGEKSISDDTETKPFLVCPKCYYRNAVDATECIKCHTTLKILPSIRTKDKKDFPSIGESTVKCPVCGVENPREVLSCKNCNYNFLKKKQDIIQIAPPSIPEGSRISCPRCGSDNEKKEQRCRVCGERLNKQLTGEFPVVTIPDVQAASKQDGGGGESAAFSFDGSMSEPYSIPGMEGKPGTEPGFQGIKPPVPPVIPGVQSYVEPTVRVVKAQPGGPVGLPKVAAPPPSVQPPIGSGGTPLPTPPLASMGVPASVQDSKTPFVPDWQQKKKGGADVKQSDEARSDKKPRGPIPVKTYLIIGGIIIAVILIAVILMLLEGKGKSKDRGDLSAGRKPAASQPGGTGEGISVEEISSNEPSAGKTAAERPPSTSTSGGVEVVEDTQGGSAKSSSEELTDLINKCRDTLNRGRINYPKDDNAIYYFLKAKELSIDSSDVELLKSELSQKLHTLGDKKLGERQFRDANVFYDLAAKVDPDDTAVSRKKAQVREFQRKTEIELRVLNAAVKSGSISELEKFIDSYPTSPYAQQAKEEIVRLKKLKQDIEAREEQRRKEEESRRAWEEKQYTFNVVHKYFLGSNRGMLLINRKGIIFEPVDDKRERFSVDYSKVQSLVYDDGEIIIKFTESIGSIGEDIVLKHITESDPKTKQIYDAYVELGPKR